MGDKNWKRSGTARERKLAAVRSMKYRHLSKTFTIKQSPESPTLKVIRFSAGVTFRRNKEAAK